jgi:pimeloyl-ACP methyl ester carboxylesterase
MQWKRAAAAVGLAILACGRPALAEEQLIMLPTRPGVEQPFWLVEAGGAPVASVILFTGGEGRLGSDGGTGLVGTNFLVRSRDKFAAQGFLVAVVDVPSDHPSGLGEFRSSKEHASDIAFVIAYLRQKAPVPVWLVGTSMGTISAANAAARLKEGGADGLVLTSSIISPSRRHSSLLGSVAVDEITVPTLFVHNRDDACAVCMFSGVPGLMNAFTHVPKRELIAVAGGDPPQSDPCEALSRHGYIGIEDQVVTAIARWIKTP